jgi:hypothetical protein
MAGETANARSASRNAGAAIVNLDDYKSGKGEGLIRITTLVKLPKALIVLFQKRIILVPITETLKYLGKPVKPSNMKPGYLVFLIPIKSMVMLASI